MKLIHRTRWGAGLAAAVLVMAGATSAQATLSGASIDASDGNLVVNNGVGDWANAGVNCTSTPTVYCGLDKPSGPNDDSFGQGTSEDTPVPTVVSGSIPPNKSDLTRFYAKIVTEPNGKDYAYLAWERVQAPTGTTNMDFELNQSKTTSTNGVTPVRTDGDILVKYDLSSGGTNLSIGYQRWLTSINSKYVPAGATTASAACEKNNSFPCWGVSQGLAGFVEGSSNTATNNPNTGSTTLTPGQVIDPIGPNAPRTLDPLTFGEASINLTDSGIIPANSCASIGQAYLKSRSSDSFTAALKDFIAPISVNFNKCGKITIVKNTVGGDGKFDYTTSANLNQTNNTFSLTTTNKTASTTFSNLFAADYSFQETGMPTGWQFTTLDCVNASGKPVSTWDKTGNTVVVHLVAQGDVTCTYTNTAQATLNIKKLTDPASDSTTSFDFTGPIVPPATTADTGSTTNFATGGALITRSNLSPGTYTWSEAAKTGWDLTGITCSDQSDANGASTVDTSTASATFNLQAGENVTCTFNNRERGTITVHKQDDATTPAALAGAVFTLYTDNAPVGGTRGGEDTITSLTCTTSATGDCSFTNVVPGNYWVVETTTPSGYTAAADQAVTVTAGATVPLTFTDPRQFTVIVLVCRNADSTLYPSTVTIDGVNKTSLATGGGGTTTDATLCALGGATYSPKGVGDHAGNVNIQ
jgi:hypothetical protein